MNLFEEFKKEMEPIFDDIEKGIIRFARIDWHTWREEDGKIIGESGYAPNERWRVMTGKDMDQCIDKLSRVIENLKQMKKIWIS